ncbi:TlpA family protein disulfide reductase [Stutzerimonas chloritidismutans]|uniref:TlpA family protein disulfide reductase n=1 Tax=Stutzerimonas chloritidismutans TaxID=203192 RepID=UPI003F141DB1
MLTLSLGPLTFGIPHLVLLVSLLLASLAGWLSGRRYGKNPERQLFRLLLLALLVARLAFVIAYVDDFESIWQVFDIRDGGFMAGPGILAALLAGGWMMWRERSARAPLATAMAVGLGSWLLMSFAGYSLERGTRLPDVTLLDGTGTPVALADFAGKPMVINLWATWCPPCRREMPVLANAQAERDDLVFLFVNQGEGVGEVERFLQAQGLTLRNSLFDSSGQLGHAVGSQALPTTLFYDAEGRQLGSHLGELSTASLSKALEGLQ